MKPGKFKRSNGDRFVSLTTSTKTLTKIVRDRIQQLELQGYEVIATTSKASKLIFKLRKPYQYPLK